MENNAEDGLPDEAQALVGTINRLACEIMCARYADLSVGMQMRLGNVIKNTRRMMEENQ